MPQVPAYFAIFQALRRNPSNRRDFVTHQTDDKSLTQTLTGSTFTNLGSASTVTFTLPQDCRGEKGVRFKFVVAAAQALRVDPGAAGAVYLDGAKQTDDKYVELTEIGTTLSVVSDGNGDWLCEVNGTYQVEA